MRKNFLELPMVNSFSLRGIRLVYDLRNLSLSNVSTKLKMWEYADAIKAVAFCHPSNIASVLLIDAPPIIRTAWNIGNVIIPQRLKDVVQWVSTNEKNPKPGEEWWRGFTDVSQLPAYVGGSWVPDLDFHSYLIHRLKTDTLLY